LGWKLRWWPRNDFHWRWSIPAIALALLVADYLYFSALRHPAAMVAVVMSLRRASTLVAFAGGLYFFREANGWRKLPAVLGILIGIWAAPRMSAGHVVFAASLTAYILIGVRFEERSLLRDLGRCDRLSVDDHETVERQTARARGRHVAVVRVTDACGVQWTARAVP